MIKKAVLILCAGICVAGGCKPKQEADAQNNGAVSSLDGDASYALGVAIASRFKDLVDEFDCDYEALTLGFREYLEDKETKVTPDQAIALVMEAQKNMYKEKEAAFFVENGKKTGMQTTQSGLQYEVLTEGAGEKPGPSDTALVHYEGKLLDGTVFDSSYTRGEPMEFPLQGIIPGWTEGLQLMGVGSKYRLFIPFELGYGNQGAGNVIPPYATLIFEVELLDIIKG